MKERKNIDRLYQEKFKDFEAAPREEVWQNISAKLKKKEEKKPLIIPFWYRLGGIAAALAVILGLTYFLNKNNIPGTDTEVVFEIDESARPTINVPENIPTLQKAAQLLDSVKIESKQNIPNSQIAGNSPGVSRGKASASGQQIAASKKAIQTTQNSDRIASENNTHKTSGEKNNSSPKSAIENSPAIAAGEPKEPEAAKASASEKTTKENSMEEVNPNALAEIAGKKNSEEVSVPEAQKGKVRLSTFAAPIFYDNLGKGNAISPEFKDNNSQARVTVAYGLNLAYPISKKLSVRTGVSKVNISYDIEEIAYGPSAFAGSIESINYHTNNNVQVQDESPAIRIPNSGGQFSEFSNNSGISPAYVSGEINQQYGFIEVPLEIEYALIDRKFDLNIIGGGSSLFLDQNSVSITANNQRTELGEANNINNVSFSTNIGLGMGYEFLPDFRLNVEPIFKYQLNTFKGTDGVQPFFFGIYSGFSYKF
ncbi:hypothetical protein RM553_04720 [Zunongwangia sp. F363]|uniref:Outer membrane protein beta-barrel domain-containing protein n=1 Tax=Autumnicola tepida TaxID=3075595 RepID=A0ABU3C712_9FLAO|nr:hypothetical protein [Zunongwangia sp. F363]MDT0642129.1 hypothetical protein [Zunongwangia sp. F363]